jgi:hypothetical protein
MGGREFAIDHELEGCVGTALHGCVLGFDASYKTAAVGKFKAILLPPTLSSHEFTVVCQRNSTHQITGVTKKALNSFGQELLEHPIPPACPAIAPPSFPCRPGSSILIDGHFEGSLTESQAHHGTGKVTKRGQCTYISCTIAYAQCRPGGM